MRKYIIAMMIISGLFLSEAKAQTGGSPEAQEIDILGKIINMEGDVDITSLSTGTNYIAANETKIRRDYKIRTGKRSFAEILLNDGTRIIMKDVTVINIMNLKLGENDPPAKVRVLTGKVRIIMKNGFNSRAMIIKTPTAVIGTRRADIGFIVSNKETKVVSFSGEVEVANVDNQILKTYVLWDREESDVQDQLAPNKPRTVPTEDLQDWFDFYIINESSGFIEHKYREEGIIDKLLRKKEY